MSPRLSPFQFVKSYKTVCPIFFSTVSQYSGGALILGLSGNKLVEQHVYNHPDLGSNLKLSVRQV